MSLPKIDLPIYELSLPSTGKQVKFRPFTVKEEKILLTAQESKDTKQVILAIKQILNNCLINMDIDKLSVFDLEYLLVMIRSKSINNIVDFEIEDPDTKETIELQIDLSNVKVEKSKNHKNTIALDPYILYLKYPNIDEFEVMLTKEEQTAEDGYNLMLSCLDKLISADDQVYVFKDFTKTEINDFMESLPGDVVSQIKLFFETIPKVRHEITYVNSKGDSKVFVIQGTQSFFI